MRQISKREFKEILKEYGYVLTRVNGSHGIYSNGKHSVSVPMVILKSVVANRLVKEILENQIA